MGRTNYEMYTPEGDLVVATMVEDIIDRIRAGELRRNDLVQAVQEGCKRVAETPRKKGERTSWGEDPHCKTYAEVYDTEPQGDIADRINEECQEQGWLPLSRWDW